MRFSTVITTLSVIILSSTVQEGQAVPVHLATRSPAPFWFNHLFGNGWWFHSPSRDPYGRASQSIFGTFFTTSTIKLQPSTFTPGAVVTLKAPMRSVKANK